LRPDDRLSGVFVLRGEAGSWKFGIRKEPDRDDRARRGEGRALGTVETFEHTADVGLRITGADLDDLFRTAAEGVFDYIVVNRDAVRVATRESIDLRADQPAALLVAWLNELIFLCETRHTLYTEFDVRVTDDGLGLHAEIGGEPVDRDRHVLDHEVKAVTHHARDLYRVGEGGWAAEVILDI
jgi:SHS2 domain-containing protein